jgi:hypothetical protein
MYDVRNEIYRIGGVQRKFGRNIGERRQLGRFGIR